jgi:integrase
MKLTASTIDSVALPEGRLEEYCWDTELKGFALRLRRGGSRTLIFQYKLGGRTTKLALGPATAESFKTAKGPNGVVMKLGVREQVAQLIARVKLGDDPAADKHTGRRNAAESFKAVSLKFLAFQREKMRVSSYRAVERYIMHHAKSLNADSLAAIDRRRLAALIVDVKEKCGATTANRFKSSLSSLFKWAVGHGLADANPTIGIPKYAERSRERVLDNNELALIWKAAEYDQYGSIVRILLLTGQRAGEIANLQWSEIGENAITLPSSRVKNKRTHVVPLSQPVLDILKAQPRRANGDGSLRELVFGDGQRGFSGWSRAKLRLDERIAKQKGKPLPAWCIHDLMRSTATGLADLGVQPHIIEAVLNHRSGSKSGVAGIYNRSSYENEKRRALEIWADHVLALAEVKPSHHVTLPPGLTDARPNV